MIKKKHSNTITGFIICGNHRTPWDKLPVKMLWDFGIKFHLQTDKTKPIVCYRVETSISAN